ncbi:MAG: ABC transporter ATP-binding protein [Tagaea sp.]|nr:ABC transporter ATP-binding protein [Tagaea sp.]
MRNPPTLHLRAARLSYEGRPLFDGLDAEFAAGRTTCLLGPSGVGKSTLLRALAGLADVGAGTRPVRAAWMAQDDLLCPWLDALGNVTLGASLRGEARDTARARSLLDQVGLGDRAAAKPSELSGGQRQRVALARTLYEDRDVVLMDEPFAGLDAPTRWRLQDLAATLLEGRTVVLVTHDPREALRLGHEIRVLAGSPATLGPSLAPAADPPRKLDDLDLLALESRLIAELMA